jgi:NhaA family Na+:H+ antiporter
VAERLSLDRQVTAAEVREVSFEVRESVSVAERLQEALHPWTGYVIVPLFALANAGVELTRDALSDALTSPVAIGIVIGLVVGKLVGITGVLLAGRRLGLPLPDEVGTGHIAGMATVAGIGFTVSIFITGLAFADEPELAAEAKIAILFASLVAAVLGALVLGASARSQRRSA